MTPNTSKTFNQLVEKFKKEVYFNKALTISEKFSATMGLFKEAVNTGIAEAESNAKKKDDKK